MNDEQLARLKTKAEADDPAAMFAYAEYLLATDPKEANRYFLLAAHLGHPFAAEHYADYCLANGDVRTAKNFFKIGARGGVADCAVKLAVMKLTDNNVAAIKELEDLAENGVKSACSALAAYYKELGNKKEYNYWRKLT